MEEKARLLEESLKREKELSDKLELANKERIETLKNNEKNVTVIKKETITKTYTPRVSHDDIRRHLRSKMSQSLDYIIQELMNSPDPFRVGSERYMTSHMHDMDRRGMGSMSALRHILRDKEHLFEHVMRTIDFDTENLHALFFHKEKTETRQQPDEILTKGLDEVKVEMKQQAFDELTEKARKALLDIPVIAKERDDATDEVTLTNNEVKLLEKKLLLASKLSVAKDIELDRAWKEYSSLQEDTVINKSKLSDINFVMSNEIGIFANRNKVNKIKQILEI